MCVYVCACVCLTQVDSFFNFFSPPDLPNEGDEIDEEAMEELQMLVETDYEVGMCVCVCVCVSECAWRACAFRVPC